MSDKRDEAHAGRKKGAEPASLPAGRKKTSRALAAICAAGALASAVALAQEASAGKGGGLARVAVALGGGAQAQAPQSPGKSGSASARGALVAANSGSPADPFAALDRESERALRETLLSGRAPRAIEAEVRVYSLDSGDDPRPIFARAMTLTEGQEQKIIDTTSRLFAVQGQASGRAERLVRLESGVKLGLLAQRLPNGATSVRVVLARELIAGLKSDAPKAPAAGAALSPAASAAAAKAVAAAAPGDPLPEQVVDVANTTVLLGDSAAATLLAARSRPGSRWAAFIGSPRSFDHFDAKAAIDAFRSGGQKAALFD
jgi:hypothetical protein